MPANCSGQIVATTLSVCQRRLRCPLDAAETGKSEMVFGQIVWSVNELRISCRLSWRWPSG